MPELPDVEAYRRFFAGHATGRTVRTVVVPDPTIVRNATPSALDRALRGHRFADPERHGKWLLAWTDAGPGLLLHFGMTGDLIWSGDEPERHRHDRLILVLDRGELRYRNMRKLGGVWLAHDRGEAALVTGALGPDALTVSKREFLERLGRRRGGVKALLMDQRFVAGVGNLVADEVLWQARLHPRRRVEDLSDEARVRLYRTMHAVLKEMVAKFDYIPRKRGWLSHVRGRPGAACPRCGTPLARITAAGRTTYFCPSCQPAPAPAPAPGAPRRRSIRPAGTGAARPTTRAARP